MEIIEKAKELVAPIIEQLDCKLYGVTFTKEGKEYVLRLYVDRKQGKIDFDTIVKISELYNEVLDKEDFISMSYTLDVSSPGAERPIELCELNEHVGDYVHVHLSHPFKGLNDLEGDLLEVTSDKAILQYREKARLKKAELLLSDIDRARLAIKF